MSWYSQHPRPMGQRIEVANRRPVFDPADLTLTQPQPFPKQTLRYAAVTVDAPVIRMLPVGTGDPAHVLGCERIPQPVACPEASRYLRWSDELVSCRPLALGTLRPRIVQSQACSATAVALATWLRTHGFRSDLYSVRNRRNRPSLWAPILDDPWDGRLLLTECIAPGSVVSGPVENRDSDAESGTRRRSALRPREKMLAAGRDGGAGPRK